PEWLLLGETLGVNPIPMGMPEVYLALKTGTVDGQENPLTILNAAKFYDFRRFAQRLLPHPARVPRRPACKLKIRRI
ncbi:MAG TPA: hypothetical protein VHD86_02700, partial [Xanthobacteraceae bacterium]|nr:hypothetical protein [Xanthobacteraceae bacterium]